MSEVAVKKQLAPETTEPARWTGFEAPFFRGSLFGVNPFAMMRQFTQEMDRAFGALPGNGTNGAWSPAIEVKQQDGKLTVTAELPGLKKEDVKVNVTNGALTIEGERKQEKEEKREGYFHSERSYGKFLRSIPLPEGAKVDKAAAQFKDGVLDVTIPLPESKEAARQIPIG